MDKTFLDDVLAVYLEYLIGLPETRINNSLIDCAVKLIQTMPEMESIDDNYHVAEQ